ncbi:sensor histidine kinase [Paenibacillus alginolyticus]|uniref:histidine kinase n=1 Tax=Paenibacillus alginolyticus TaxID=59839 RepID=A0ABT4GB45_9BACL|nr:HAMP domain-containing sensor histidine kinase [Paenibacillus alginolyticus]MCY9693379.1 HAMP domain-containing histidine kinase [Paenibacillus alginolyticus]MEC0144638.1 HAMP domain-containing sensor histidine kinase [Paenibacillus alginolyticus]
MIKGLYGRHVVAYIGIAAGILLITCITLIIEMLYHFSMYRDQDMGMGLNISILFDHLELAVIQSVLWTSVIGIILAVLISLYVAKKITAPLLEMKKVSELMAQGHLEARTKLKGKDELTDLGNSLNFLAEQLQKQEHLRKIMTSDIAHELRTPLTTLKSHMLALLDGIWEPTPDRIRGCHEEIERLIDLVGDLEQLTEMESPHFHLDLQNEDISLIVDQAVESMRPAFVEKQIQLTVNETNSIFLKVDRKRFVQILINLFSNALKYTPEGNEISVQLKEDGNKVELFISDTGIGIHSNELPYVFERLYRVDKSRGRKSGGSGIGLTIVKKLVEAHGGNVLLESKEGVGTTAHLLFTK